MGILASILIIVEVIVCLLLIGLVLIQKARGEGLGLAFGSGMGETLFGSRAGNVLTKATIGFGIAFLVNTLVLALVYGGAQERSLMSREIAPVSTPVDVQRAMPVEGGAGTPVAPVQPVASAPTAAPSGAPTLPGASLDDPVVPPSLPPAAEEPQP